LLVQYIYTVSVVTIAGATIAMDQTCLIQAIHVTMVALTFRRGNRRVDVVVPAVASTGRRNDRLMSTPYHQGSVLGSLFFILYTAQVRQVVVIAQVVAYGQDAHDCQVEHGCTVMNVTERH
jgi:hypothetical protein